MPKMNPIVSNLVSLLKRADPLRCGVFWTAVVLLKERDVAKRDLVTWLKTRATGARVFASLERLDLTSSTPQETTVLRGKESGHRRGRACFDTHLE